MSKTDRMRKIRDELVELTGSPLYEYRVENNYLPVVGQGNHDADILFIGEAPGKNEAEQGIPFCGRSGDLLTEFIEGIGLTREDVYITNVVKDRPPENRDPSAAEIALYTPYLARQIEIIEPKVIATLGRFAMEFIFEHFSISGQVTTITKMHGTPATVKAAYGKVQVMPLFHPAVALYDGSKKKVLQKDFEKMKNIIS